MKFFNPLLQHLRRGATAAVLSILAAISAGVAPAHADWLKAESERFIVYSEGGEGKLREFVQELETFDRFLRLRMGLDVNETPPRKLPIYLVASRRGLTQVRPDLPENVAGFYMATDEDIFGIALRDQTVNTLKHEYAHHFMMQNFSYPYPGWFVEGFAEYFATVEIEKSRILVGKYNENRASWLRAASWMPMAELLSKRPLQRARNRETYYPLAWLLTHWFLGDPERQKALDAYLRDVGAGGDPVDDIGVSFDRLLVQVRGLGRRAECESLQQGRLYDARHRSDHRVLRGCANGQMQGQIGACEIMSRSAFASHPGQGFMHRRQVRRRAVTGSQRGGCGLQTAPHLGQMLAELGVHANRNAPG